MADDRADDPLRWDRYQVVSRRRRAVDLTVQTLDGLCSLEGTRFEAPFLDERFLSTLAAWAAPLGRGDRTAVMTELFSNVLPGPVLARTSKATFGGVFFGPESRSFAKKWTGGGLSPELVDGEALRQAWLAPVPVFGSALPLQAAWLFRTNEASGRRGRLSGPLGDSSPIGTLLNWDWPSLRSDRGSNERNEHVSRELRGADDHGPRGCHGYDPGQAGYLLRLSGVDRRQFGCTSPPERLAPSVECSHTEGPYSLPSVDRVRSEELEHSSGRVAG